MGILELCIRDANLFNTIQNMLIDFDRKQVSLIFIFYYYSMLINGHWK
jgi:hypothetical protein